MTSIWMRWAPAASASRTCSPRRVKSADKIEGTIPIVIFVSSLLPLYPPSTPPRHPLGARSEQGTRLAGMGLQGQPVTHRPYHFRLPKTICFVLHSTTVG